MTLDLEGGGHGHGGDHPFNQGGIHFPRGKPFGGEFKFDFN